MQVRDDREDVRGALAAEIEPGEEPVASTEDEPPELALAAIVRELDVAVFEEEQESRATADAGSRGLGRVESWAG